MRLLEDGTSIVALLKSHPQAVFSHHAEKILGSVLVARHSSTSHGQQHEVSMSRNTEDNQGGDFPTMDANNAFLGEIFDFPYFGTSDWSFDPINLDNIELS